MTTAGALGLYGTIWVSLLLFAIGEVGRRDRDAGRRASRRTWLAYTAGAALACTHLVLAMAWVHGWSHQASVTATARQTRAVFGLDWGGGVWFNYAFVAVWLFECWRWWREDTAVTATPPRRATVVWALRAFFLIMIANAAVVFAVGARRLLGAMLVSWLLWLWWPRPIRRRPIR